VEGSGGRELTGVEAEARGPEWRALPFAVPAQPLGGKARRGVAMQTSKGGVRVECFQVGVESEGEQPVVDLLAELKKVGMGVLHAGPKDLRLSARRKCADSSEREDEAGDADGGQRVL